MDWAKAKTILIAVFLATNIFLAYTIIGDNTDYNGHVGSEKIKLVTDYLAEKGITIKGDIPKKKSDMPSITVKYKLFSEEDIIESLLASEENLIVSVEGNIINLRGKNTEVAIKDRKELVYKDNGVKPAETAEEKVCRKNIENFLAKLNIRNNADIRKVEDVEGYKKYVYVQDFKGADIYNSILEFYVNNSGVHKARIVWFDTIRQAGKKSEVISPDIALLYLPGYYKNNPVPGKEVLDIQQGYYFGIGARGQVDASMVEEGTAFPVWRITTDKEIIYINAYNEKAEGIEKARE